MKLEDFENISEFMYWREEARTQLEEFRKLAKAFACEPTVVGTHISKSINLPVMKLHLKEFEFLLQCNFYNIEIAVRAEEPVTLPMAKLFEGVLTPLSWEWYLTEISKCAGYSWNGWSGDQVADITVTEVEATNLSGRKYMNHNSLESKARWVKRMTDPEWYQKDWSSSTLTSDDPFGPGATLFQQDRLFAEGISDLIPYGEYGLYYPGSRFFGVSVGNYGLAKTLIRNLTDQGSK